MSLEGGPPLVVVDSGVNARFGSWGPDNFLYLDGRVGEAIVRVPASGGKLEIVTTPDANRGEVWHFQPDVLPNGKGVLFTASAGDSPGAMQIAVAHLATGTHETLLRGTSPRYATSGHLIYVTGEGTLMAAPFDQDALTVTGPSVALVEGLTVGLFAAVDLAISDAGTLAYWMGHSAAVRPAWVARDGTVDPIEFGRSVIFTPSSQASMSPDGSRLAVSLDENAESQVWIKRLPAGPLSKLTFEGDFNIRPTWTPDGECGHHARRRRTGLD